MMDKLSRMVLVLNNSYEAICVTSAKRAFTLVMGGKASVLEVSEVMIHTQKLSLPVPSVIKLNIYRKVPRSNKSISRRSIMVRDHHTCQYCGVMLESKKLTLDHIRPRSKGGKNTWENLVTCCYPCNNAKGDKSLEESGMVLLRKPTQLGVHAKHRAMAPVDSSAWDKYLFV